MSLIKVEGLKTHFYKGKGILSKLFGKGLRTIHAVDGISFSIKGSETFGLVGESGCGKSTVGNSIVRLVEPIEGEIFFEGTDILQADESEMREFRRNAQLIFQDPRSCLNPRMTAGEIIAEPLRVAGTRDAKKESQGQIVAELLDAVNLSPEDAYKYPHEFSGGQARRIGVARAIALNPKFIIADEPTSGLDVSTAATILNLMQDIQEKYNLTYLWISHNLHVVKHVCDKMAVMYLGKIVEMGKTEDVFKTILHPYTRALFSVIPRIDFKSERKKIILKGEVPSPINPPAGCRFRPRCERALPKCTSEEPELIDAGGGHFAACHLLFDHC
ncbi:MAG: ABC transporter ATP-binding protein [Desulfobacteraceae bacterium]|nr:ABC transporter ATP-binding protein [Desulfobacteraceae bacterium]